MPAFLHKIAVKLMVNPFVWASNQQKQTTTTRLIRFVWRAL